MSDVKLLETNCLCLLCWTRSWKLDIIGKFVASKGFILENNISMILNEQALVNFEATEWKPLGFKPKLMQVNIVALASHALHLKQILANVAPLTDSRAEFTPVPAEPLQWSQT